MGVSPKKKGEVIFEMKILNILNTNSTRIKVVELRFLLSIHPQKMLDIVFRSQGGPTDRGI
jgi:hypothetical protein